jgi:hypothetical protein
MPNTLVHFAAQGAASRGAWPRLDARWIYLGCLLPDVPWILRRAVVGIGLPVDAVLGTNTLLHLLLDATELKFGNGVHLAAPVSWRMTSFELLPGESAVYLALAVAGLLLVGWEIARPRPARVGIVLRPSRLAASVALLAAYLAFPIPFLGAIQASGSYSVETLREVDARAGRTVRLDRTLFEASPAGGVVHLWTGERVRATGSAVPDRSATVSLEGTFLAPDVLRVDRVFVHRRNRDWPSYVALALLLALWLRPARATG